MRTTVGLIALVGALAVSSASATPESNTATPVDPEKQVLQKSDFPAGATYESDLGLDKYLVTPLKAAGLTGQAGQYFAATYSKAKGFLKVSGIVITVPNAAAARRAFPIVTKARAKLTGTSDWRAVSLPRYGNEQTARVNPPGNEGIALLELIVRKDRFVWLLYVSLERRPKPPVTEIVADARRYAAKQQRRLAGS